MSGGFLTLIGPLCSISAILRRENGSFDEMMMMSPLY